MTVSEEGAKVQGRGMAKCDRCALSSGSMTVTVEVGEDGYSGCQYIGVVRAGTACGDYSSMCEKGAWYLTGDGSVYEDGDRTAGRGWAIKGQAVTMVVDMDARTLTLSRAGESDVVLTGLPDDGEAVVPAVALGRSLRTLRSLYYRVLCEYK